MQRRAACFAGLVLIGAGAFGAEPAWRYVATPQADAAARPVLRYVALSGAKPDGLREEAEELIGKMKQDAQQSMAYGMLADALPEKARARKLEVIAEALVGARAERSPELRAVALGQVAKRLWALGDKERATRLLREGEKVARGLSTSAFAGYARAGRSPPTWRS